MVTKTSFIRTKCSIFSCKTYLFHWIFFYLFNCFIVFEICYLFESTTTTTTIYISSSDACWSLDCENVAFSQSIWIATPWSWIKKKKRKHVQLTWLLLSVLVKGFWVFATNIDIFNALFVLEIKIHSQQYICTAQRARCSIATTIVISYHMYWVGPVMDSCLCCVFWNWIHSVVRLFALFIQYYFCVCLVRSQTDERTNGIEIERYRWIKRRRVKYSYDWFRFIVLPLYIVDVMRERTKERNECSQIFCWDTESKIFPSCTVLFGRVHVFEYANWNSIKIDRRRSKLH